MSRRVLIVDDNRELAENLAEILEMEGLEALVMDDPLAVLHAARELRFDAALLDVRMPGMDGIDLLRQLAEHSPDAVYVLMTAFTKEERLAQRDARVRRVLAKPFGPDVLIAALRDVEVVGAGGA
ncbi:response regulator [Sandaracinus amylolyticus]|uniref:Response regulator n=1 Tax=Sandaracinus amylolyticus TaxID=927083 RepID=A0A0F6YKS9_9BACT|nr:response regulator [Sandaracinus amylolyticus]AKF08510.1 Response regulator [Sandaracinus amylolyticus]